jgi:hypothetical protein
MALKFKSSSCKVTNLKYHKNGKGENAPVPLDIKLSLMCAGSVLNTLLGGKASSIWKEGRNKDLALPYLGGCSCGSVFTYCQVNIGGAELKDGTMSKISFTPLPGGQVDLSFNISVEEVSAAGVNKLRQLLQTTCEMVLSGGDLVVLSEDEEGDDDQQEDLLEDAEEETDD